MIIIIMFNRKKSVKEHVKNSSMFQPISKHGWDQKSLMYSLKFQQTLTRKKAWHSFDLFKRRWNSWEILVLIKMNFRLFLQFVKDIFVKWLFSLKSNSIPLSKRPIAQAKKFIKMRKNHYWLVSGVFFFFEFC